MGLLKVALYMFIAMFVTNLATQNDRKLIKKIPVVGSMLANIENLNLYIIIACLVILVFFI
jgi:hypothetical protein